MSNRYAVRADHERCFYDVYEIASGATVGRFTYAPRSEASRAVAMGRANASRNDMNMLMGGCPCNHEKSIDPHCAAAGHCSRETECGFCGEIVGKLHDVSRFLEYGDAWACADCASQMEQDEHDEQSWEYETGR